MVRAERLAFIVNGADYFRVAKQAMAQARHSIYLIGWEFDLKTRLTPGEDDSETPDNLADFLSHIVKRSDGLNIHVLQWDGAMLLNLSRQLGSFLQFKLKNDSRVQFRLDSEHPVGACHHQKILVIDDTIAFCGGIDITRGRWDTSAHAADDDRRRDPSGEKFGPWHDITLAVDGEAARELGELARDRWLRATGKTLPAPAAREPFWPEALPVSCSDVDIGIARTMPAHRGGSCTNEIEHLWLKIIKSAKRLLYIESQFLTSAAIADALEQRLREREGPQIVIILPHRAEMLGERKVMDDQRSLIVSRLQTADGEDRLRVLYPVNDAEDPVYVHAKLIIADDHVIRIGSSNMSNRSMRLDSECDIVLAAEEGDSESAAIIRLRNQLVAEHLGVSDEDIRNRLEEHDQDLIRVLDATGFDTVPGLRVLVPDELDDVERSFVESNILDPQHPSRRSDRLARFAGGLLMRKPATVAVSALFAVIAFAAIKRRQR